MLPSGNWSATAATWASSTPCPHCMFPRTSPKIDPTQTSTAWRLRGCGCFARCALLRANQVCPPSGEPGCAGCRCGEQHITWLQRRHPNRPNWGELDQNWPDTLQTWPVFGRSLTENSAESGTLLIELKPKLVELGPTAVEFTLFRAEIGRHRAEFG